MEEKRVDIEEYRKMKKSQSVNNKSGFRKLLYVLLAFIVFGGIIFSPIFSIKNININEMEKYTKEEICSKLGVNEGTNIFSFLLSGYKNKIKDDYYFESIDVSISLPSTVNIDIKERKVRGYIPFMGSYLYIDEYGTVLDVQENFKNTLPIVEGLEFNNFKIGEKLQVDNPESFEVIVTIAQLITKYNILEDFVKIDVKDPKDIRASMKNVEVYLGDLTDCDEKIRTMIAVMEQIDEKDRGTLDLRDLSKPIIFKYLT